MFKYNLSYKTHIYILVPIITNYRDIVFIQNIIRTMSNYYLCQFEFDDESSNEFTVTIYENTNITVYRDDSTDNFVFLDEDDGNLYECTDDGIVITDKPATVNPLIGKVTSNEIVASVRYCLVNNISLCDINGNPVTTYNDDQTYIRLDTYQMVKNIVIDKQKRNVNVKDGIISVTYTLTYMDSTDTCITKYPMPDDYYYTFTDPDGIVCNIDVLYNFTNYDLTVKPVNNLDSFDVYKANVNGVMRIGTSENIPYDYESSTQVIDDTTYKTPPVSFKASKELFTVNIACSLNKYIDNFTITLYDDTSGETTKQTETITGNDVIQRIVAYNSSQIIIGYNDVVENVPFENSQSCIQNMNTNDFTVVYMSFKSIFKLESNGYYIVKSNGVPIHDGYFGFQTNTDDESYIGGIIVTCINYSTYSNGKELNLNNRQDNLTPSDTDTNLYMCHKDSPNIKLYQFQLTLSYTFITKYQGMYDTNFDIQYTLICKCCLYYPYIMNSAFAYTYNSNLLTDTSLKNLLDLIPKRQAGKFYMFKPKAPLNFYIKLTERNSLTYPNTYYDDCGLWEKQYASPLLFSYKLLIDLTRFTDYIVISDLNDS